MNEKSGKAHGVEVTMFSMIERNHNLETELFKARRALKESEDKLGEAEKQRTVLSGLLDGEREQRYSLESRLNDAQGEMVRLGMQVGANRHELEDLRSDLAAEKELTRRYTGPDRSLGCGAGSRTAPGCFEPVPNDNTLNTSVR